MLINLCLTLKCNLDCDYCYAESSPSAKRMSTVLALDSAKFIMDTARKESVRTLGIGFIGGEPLLCIDTIKQTTDYVSEQCAEINFPVSFILTTNGTLLTPEIAEFFKEHDFHMSLSIDGPKSVHDVHRKYHNGKGSFEDVNLGIGLASEILPGTVARMTFTSKTVDYLAESIHYLADLGFKIIKPVPDFFDLDWTQDHVNRCERQFDQILAWLPSYLNHGRQVRIGPIEQRLNQIAKSPCNAGLTNSQFSIGPNGSIYPCSYQVDNPDFVIGDIYSGIDPDRAQKVHRIDQQPFTRSACQGCALFSTCDSGRCTFLNMRMTGKMDIPSPFYCAYEKMMFRILEKYKMSGLSTHQRSRPDENSDQALRHDD
ncbi:MAG: radical SAM protein [Chloroflexota bacterium]